jgi:hypothetical protein
VYNKLMATTRGSASSYDVGNKPPIVTWTVVRGDTASFRVYVTDDAKQPLNIPDWDISMKIKRPNSATNLGVITDDAELVMTLTPEADLDDASGEFTVSLTASESHDLETGDIFDIQLSTQNNDIVWTVAQGKMVILEDVTD